MCIKLCHLDVWEECVIKHGPHPGCIASSFGSCAVVRDFWDRYLSTKTLPEEFGKENWDLVWKAKEKESGRNEKYQWRQKIELGGQRRAAVLPVAGLSAWHRSIDRSAGRGERSTLEQSGWAYGGGGVVTCWVCSVIRRAKAFLPSVWRRVRSAVHLTPEFCLLSAGVLQPCSGCSGVPSSVWREIITV